MSAELMKSKFVRRLPSVCGIDYLWSYCIDFFQILVVASPGPYAQTFFYLFIYFFFFCFLWLFFIFVNMGGGVNQADSMYSRLSTTHGHITNFK